MFGHGWVQSTYVEDSMTEALAVHLDFAALVECTAAMNDSALGFSVSVALEMQPKEALACFAAATHEVRLHCTILRPRCFAPMNKNAAAGRVEMYQHLRRLVRARPGVRGDYHNRERAP
jgi:hypothetical protein